MQEQDYLWEAADSWHRQRRNEARELSDRELALGLEAEGAAQESRERTRKLATRTEDEEAASREMEAKLGIVHGPAFVDRKSEFPKSGPALFHACQYVFNACIRPKGHNS